MGGGGCWGEVRLGSREETSVGSPLDLDEGCRVSSLPLDNDDDESPAAWRASFPTCEVNSSWKILGPYQQRFPENLKAIIRRTPETGYIEVDTMSTTNWKLSDDKGLRDCKRSGGLSNKVALFNQVADSHKEKQMINPFSAWDGASHRNKLDKSDASYGKPLEGSKTEKRGKAAQASVNNEMRTLCEMIHDCGCTEEDSTSWITFGELFQTYTVISGNVVGILLRARKRGFVDFPGETLFQRRDDDVVIQLTRPLAEIKEILATSGS
ncbi:unnamed protein product [Notodromas monacha]|uniref:Costars domain-containing protein n=1 Tax=Notodromas monacha TaxID=399045 RepID=A0A7R9GHC1_9CRUS|nr:unnamed protein product [Notodromas monacha]CAG0920759.1 unnamed protein product [Notodromas monacha]